MRLRRAGICRSCTAALPAGTLAVYERADKTLRCVSCSETLPASPDLDRVMLPRLQSNDAEVLPLTPVVPDRGVAGASARREYDKRKAADQERLRSKWGKLGRLAIALSDEPQSTAAWERGATGEERLGQHLDALEPQGIASLHDRRIPGTRANIDHIVVTRGGVWVIDAKRYTGRPTLRVEGGFLRPRLERLFVGGRDRTSLVDGVVKQVGLVQHVVDVVPVIGALCFVDADWPLMGGSFRTRQIHVLWPKRLSKVLVASSDGEVDVSLILSRLAQHFPPS